MAESETSGKDKEILVALSQSSASKESLAAQVVLAKAPAVIWLERAQPLQQCSFSLRLVGTGQRNNSLFSFKSQYSVA